MHALNDNYLALLTWYYIILILHIAKIDDNTIVDEDKKKNFINK